MSISSLSALLKGPSDGNDKGSSRMKIKVLTRNNWMQWFEQLTLLFMYKGYEMLFDEEWVKKNKLNSDYKIKNAFAMSTLYNTVHEDLQPLLYDQKDFGQAIQSLRMASGKTSVISLCDSLFEMDLTFNPLSSLQAHVLRFQKKYTTFKCLVANTNGLVNITEEAAAGFLLRSLKQDSSLSSLIQNLYDIKPFTIKRVIKRLLAEHGWRTSGDGNVNLNVNNSNNTQQSKRTNEPKLWRKKGKTQKSGLTPTNNNNDNIDKRFKQIESNIQLLLKLHNKNSTNQVEEDSQLSISVNDADGPNGFLTVDLRFDYETISKNY
ncbi:hypothetical protein O181_127493 [Austropuccinia psidii MF-1]|uniref:Uncharacterized protein n=1 Tax=Austropuccinia psidii MF-1 TaxID=1389203 RepID=A0A9Q3Q706_9BASI|nr:hypothetical protein [Austropuccinia psidii MF-1]